MIVLNPIDSGAPLERTRWTAGRATCCCALGSDEPTLESRASRNLDLLYGGPPRVRAAKGNDGGDSEPAILAAFALT